MPKDHVRHEAIKSTLHLRGSSFSMIARELKISITAVSLVARGRSRSRRIETAIAEQSGLSLARLWPERYEKAMAADATTCLNDTISEVDRDGI